MKIRLEHRKGKNGSGTISAKFYILREKTNVHTSVDCDVKDWDPIAGRVKISDKFYSDKNLIIDHVLARINNVFVKYRLRNRTLTRSLFYKSYNKPDDFDNFYIFFEDQIKKERKRLEASTITIHKTVFEKLKQFRPTLHFEEITEEFLVDFFCYLHKVYKNTNSTAYKNMSILKKYVRIAIKLGYIEENPFNEFAIKDIESKPVYLKENELNALIKLYKDGDMQLNKYKTLQLFFFMCFGSQHIGDAKKMEIDQIGSNEFYYLRQKTKNIKPKLIHVPISKAFKWILNDIVGNRKKGFVFENLPSDQKMNEWLKQLAKEAGVDKDISHKTGRHTFATYFLSKTKDLNTLKEILGHSNIRETLIYAHVLNEDKQIGIKCFNSIAI